MSTSEQEFTFSDWYLSLALFFQMQDIINTQFLTFQSYIQPTEKLALNSKAFFPSLYPFLLKIS